MNIIDCYEPVYGFGELETLMFTVLFVVFSIVAGFSIFSVVRVIQKMNLSVSAKDEAAKYRYVNGKKVGEELRENKTVFK